MPLRHVPALCAWEEPSDQGWASRAALAVARPCFNPPAAAAAGLGLQAPILLAADRQTHRACSVDEATLQRVLSKCDPDKVVGRLAAELLQLPLILLSTPAAASSPCRATSAP